MATYLSRTPSSAGNRKTFTISLWFKRSLVGDRNCLLSTDGSNDHDRFELTIHQNDYLMVGLNSFNVFETNMLFRDVSAWYHIMFVADTTQGSSSNRTKLYINGSQVTSFSANNQNSISSNFDFGVNNTNAHKIGASPSNTDGTNGYIADFNLIDGSALTPSSFGETDSTTGIWKPKSISGLTYGTNGVYLQFKNSGALGTDTSGNSNTYAVNNAGTNAQVTDTPNNNFCTMNSIDKGSDAGTLSLGNLKITNGTSGSASNQKVRGTLAVSSGKWYFEMKQLANTTSIGLLATEEEQSTTTANGMFVEYLIQGEMRYWNGSSRVTKTTAIDSYTANDIVGCALDMDNRRAYFSKNGVWQGDPTPDPASSPSGAGQMAPILSGYTMSPCFYDDTTSSAGQAAMNFGNSPFSISSGNADANGFGNFEYAVPSGYYALCTKNINTYG